VAGVTRVKVCGLTRAEDVRLAAELGAWALGFVLTGSPRHVTPAQAAGLATAARAARPETVTVAVVTTEPPGWIAGAVEQAGLDAVQLSAGADGATVAEVREAAEARGPDSGLPRPLVIAAADTPDAGDADFVLLDARTTGAYGGTGRRLDWQGLAADPSTPRAHLILAGGLEPGNVAAAIAALQPEAVDISSGVESAPGVKDHQLVRDFFTAVVQADGGAATRRITG
jgi:phosphoribosylanthranilate isomerase